MSAVFKLSVITLRFYFDNRLAYNRDSVVAGKKAISHILGIGWSLIIIEPWRLS